MGQNAIGRDGLRALVSCPCLRALKTLLLKGVRMGNEGLAGLLLYPEASQCLDSLEVLDLEGTEIDAGGVGMLCRWRGLARLKSLKLSCNQLGDAGICALSRCPFLGRLETLDVKLTEFQGACLASLALSSENLPRLRVLDISFNFIGLESLRTLCASELWRGLEVLKVQSVGSVPGLDILRTVAEVPGSGRFRELWVDIVFLEGDPVIPRDFRVVSSLSCDLGNWDL